MTDLNELLERVRAATGPDRELDGRLFVGLKIDPSLSNLSHHAGYVLDGSRNAYTVAAYTASIDAALAMAGRCLPEHRFAIFTDGQGKGPCCLVMIGDDPVVAQEFGKTPPIAILNALLQALISQEQK